jgi:hypothetical protein
VVFGRSAGPGGKSDVLDLNDNAVNLDWLASGPAIRLACAIVLPLLIFGCQSSSTLRIQPVAV